MTHSFTVQSTNHHWKRKGEARKKGSRGLRPPTGRSQHDDSFHWDMRMNKEGSVIREKNMGGHMDENSGDSHGGALNLKKQRKNGKKGGVVTGR